MTLLLYQETVLLRCLLLSLMTPTKAKPADLQLDLGLYTKLEFTLIIINVVLYNLMYIYDM